jgi:hypothetical protein
MASESNKPTSAAIDCREVLTLAYLQQPHVKALLATDEELRDAPVEAANFTYSWAWKTQLLKWSGALALLAVALPTGLGIPVGLAAAGAAAAGAAFMAELRVSSSLGGAMQPTPGLTLRICAGIANTAGATGDAVLVQSGVAAAVRDALRRRTLLPEQQEARRLVEQQAAADSAAAAAAAAEAAVPRARTPPGTPVLSPVPSGEPAAGTQ